MNTRHSPHIKAQMDLDDNIIKGWFLIVLIVYLCVLRENDRVTSLRTNFLNHDMGKITLENLI